VPLDELSRQSLKICEGEVVALESSWDAGRSRIFTAVSVRVSDSYTGASNDPQTIRLLLLGGTVGDVTLAVLGQPSFEMGERVFLFLSPSWNAGGYPVVAGEHGKFTVSTDPSNGAELLLNEGTTLRKAETLSNLRRLISGRRDGR
jgi:hypothetical protein